jgi:ATP synthase protein I
LKNDEGLPNYAKYSALAFQMLALIGLAVWGGLTIDEKIGWRIPIVTIVLVFLALGGSMYWLIKGLQK